MDAGPRRCRVDRTAARHHPGGRYGINVYDFVVRFFVFYHKTWSQPGVECVIQGQTGNEGLTNPTVDQGWQIQQV